MEIGDIISYSILTFLVIFFAVGIIFTNQRIASENNEFCISKGYNQSTDYNLGFVFDRQIECDNIIVFNITEVTNIFCIEYDKWGECIKDKKTTEMLEVFNE
jgi:hypothetical protein